jgi:hypothetical protein
MTITPPYPNIPDQETIGTAINEACVWLYENENAKRLIDEKAHERTIVPGYLLPELKNRFPGWDVDPDYNREGIDRGPKKDLDGKLLVPDVIIHKRGPKGPNLVTIQVKGYWNHENRKIDEGSLQRLQAKHHYKYLYRLELGPDKHELIRVEFNRS